jgi:murein DD-endopeptidase MepM/ murein hydrolase activator NlpD
MKTLQQRNNVGLAGRFRAAFKTREIIMHDGRALRRVRIGTRVQLAATAAAASLLAWSGYATVQYASATGTGGDVAQMQQRVAQMEQDVQAIRAAADERAEQLEKRQALLATMMRNEASPDEVAQFLPAQLETPANPAALEVTQAYSQVDGMQLMMAQQAHQVAQQRIQRTSNLVRSLGLDPSRMMQAGGVGGPFVEADGGEEVDPRFLQLFASWRQLESLEQGVASIPSVMPVQGIRYTSGFGVRSDPFRSRAAMHAGIDLAGPVGTPIHATADGVVARSGIAGGYGNLVELDHGSGIGTRYGHMSRLLVQAGERVRRGQVIGLMGSTGRSTGSHLHYEVRIDGRAVNPLPFLQTGEALAAAQSQSGGGQAGSRR